MEKATERQKKFLLYNMHLLPEGGYEFIMDRLDKGRASDLIEAILSIPPLDPNHLWDSVQKQFEVYMNQETVNK